MPIHITMDHDILKGKSTLTLHIMQAPFHYNSSLFLYMQDVEIDYLSI